MDESGTNQPTSPPTETTPAAESTPPASYSVEQFLSEAAEAPPLNEQTAGTPTETFTPSVGRQPRDYSGLEEHEAGWFKSMANESFNKLLPIYKEYKRLKPEHEKLQEQLKSTADSRWYAHEKAYTLSPEVSELQNQHANLQFEEQFWQQQLAKLRAGEKANALAIANNQYQLGAELEAGPQSEAQVLANLQKAQIYQQSVLTNIDNIARDFGGKYKSMQGKLNEYGTKLFGQLPEPLLQKSKEVLESFPPEVRNQQEYQLLAKAAVVINALMNRLKEVEKRGQIVNRTIQGPSSWQQTPGSTAGGDDWKAFQRLLS